MPKRTVQTPSSGRRSTVTGGADSHIAARNVAGDASPVPSQETPGPARCVCVCGESTTRAGMVIASVDLSEWLVQGAALSWAGPSSSLTRPG